MCAPVISRSWYFSSSVDWYGYLLSQSTAAMAGRPDGPGSPTSSGQCGYAERAGDDAAAGSPLRWQMQRQQFMQGQRPAETAVPAAAVPDSSNNSRLQLLFQQQQFIKGKLQQQQQMLSIQQQTQQQKFQAEMQQQQMLQHL